MLMEDSTAAISNHWCMPGNLLGGAILFDPLNLDHKSDFKIQIKKIAPA